MEEALAVADRVAVMQPRRIARVGTPQEVYRDPRSEYVARFLGLDNLVAARLDRAGGRPVLRTELGDLPAEALTPPDDDDADLKVLLRPTGIAIHEDAPERPVSSPDRWVLHGELTGRSFRGARSTHSAHRRRNRAPLPGCCRPAPAAGRRSGDLRHLPPPRSVSDSRVIKWQGERRLGPSRFGPVHGELARTT